MVLRAKLFMQKLHVTESLTWGCIISDDLLKEWFNITRQVNSTPVIQFNRFVGRRDGDYSLLCFIDASDDVYGCVLYTKDNAANKVREPGIR